MASRVVVTGIGVITSIGIGKDEFWKNVVAGVSGISEIASFDTADFENHRGGEIKNFDARQFMTGDEMLKMGRGAHLAIAATRLALSDSKMGSDRLEEIGVSLGTTMGEVIEFENTVDAWVKGGVRAIGNVSLAHYPCHTIPSNVAKHFGFGGANVMIPNACDAGNCAIGYAYDLINSGKADRMVAGGVDPFSKTAFVGFNRLGAVSPDVPRPFDKDRKGMMVGEGAGILILEKLDSALARKADIYAEILGYGLSCDAAHMTAQHPRGNGVALAIARALKNAGIRRDRVDYINVHGTGTPENDEKEVLAIKRVFGKQPRLLVSSTKSMLGHTMGAASAIEATVCVMAVKNDLAPPTMNIREIDPIVDFDVLPNQAKKSVINIAMNNGSAFGGNNASVIFSKYIDRKGIV